MKTTSKVYLYGRVSTDQQSLDQQERTVYEWLKHHNMVANEVVCDEGISGGVSYKERNLGKVLLPKMIAGDILIVSEISRLGRSMYDLSKLIHEELQPRKVRLIIVGMGIDLNCNEMKPIDNLILNNFAFAAELEKHLISERTLSALQVKRKQGVKLGAASPLYQERRKLKSKEQIKIECMKQGQTKRLRWRESRDCVALRRILVTLFPDATKDEDPMNWDWKHINTKNGMRDRMCEMIVNFKAIDQEGKLFRKIDIASMSEEQKTLKMCSLICNLRRSYIG